MRTRFCIGGLIIGVFLGCHARNVAGSANDIASDAEGRALEVVGSDLGPIGDAEAGSEVDEGDSRMTGDQYHYVPDLGLYLCMSPDECPPGMVCGDRYCVECYNNDDCPSGFCTGAKTCVPVTCQSPEDCVPYYCKDGKCVECLTKEDCWPNENCEFDRCELNEPCTTTPDCPEGYECFMGTCVQWECKSLTQPFADTCPPDSFCDDNTHRCVPDVCPPGLGICKNENSGWVCRPDGSGFLTFDHCPYGKKCVDGHCREVELPPPICDPSCEGRECGVDGCGTLCGVCEVGQACEDGKCFPVNAACFPRLEPGCPDCPCEGLVCKIDPECCAEKWDLACAQECDVKDPGLSCPECASVLPAGCAIRECGVEPCGVFCGGCEKGGTCVNGTCLPGIPPDMGRGCGSDPECASGLCAPVGRNGEMVCTAGCGVGVACPSGWTCEGGRCRVKPDCLGACLGRQCGVDECGSPCGSCPPDKVCDGQGRCVEPGQGCDPTPGVPTCGGCACQTCVCSWMPSCCSQEWSFACTLTCQGPQCDPLGVMASACAKPPNPCAGFECGTVWIEEQGGLYDCGSCAAGWTCVGRRCVCQPQCEGRVCGPDGCGGWCGADSNGNPPSPPTPNVFCEDGVWKFVPAACLVGAGPHCYPGPPGWACMDFDCICDAMPLCCPPGFWEQSCVDYAMTFCGLECDPQPWTPWW